MTWTPNDKYRYTFKLGMTGWDVWALQVAIAGSGLAGTITKDGSFGPETERAVKKIQETFHIVVDGIAGPETQAKICQRASSNATPGHVPAGLLKGICEGESGYIIPTTSGPYADNSRDYGPFQAHLLNPTTAQLEVAFNANKEAVDVAAELRGAYLEYKGQPGALTDEKAWRLAVLDHNWPAAAFHLANGTASTWTYESEGKLYKMSDPAPWVESFGIEGVKTGYDWCKFYIESKVMYVSAWTV